MSSPDFVLGRISFGPSVASSSAADVAAWRKQAMARGQTVEAHSCFCRGPQGGETLCPCAVRAEAEKHRRMIAEGVTIGGVTYDLVPRRKPHSDRMAVGE